MIFDHKVKVNGVYYDAGVDVPASGEPVAKTEPQNEIPSVEEKEPSLKDLIISTNNVMKLKKIGKDNGVTVVGNSSIEVKEELITKLGL